MDTTTYNWETICKGVAKKSNKLSSLLPVQNFLSWPLKYPNLPQQILYLN